jgi:chromate reductase, NAD(P)H dehydrogenase (quinone)
VASVWRVLLISGSLRQASTNTAVLRTAIGLAPDACAATLYSGMADLPAFNPDLDGEPLPPAVVGLRRQIREADALLFSTPEYAGALPGSFKNLLDRTVGDDSARSIDKKPVAWLNVAARGAPHAHESLRRVLGYVGGDIVEEACLGVPVTNAMVGEDGLVTDHAVRRLIADAVGALAGAFHS